MIIAVLVAAVLIAASVILIGRDIINSIDLLAGDIVQLSDDIVEAMTEGASPEIELRYGREEEDEKETES